MTAKPGSVGGVQTDRHRHTAGPIVSTGLTTMLDRLSDSIGFQSEALVLRAERQRLLASNIANADTPGYVARDMDFAATLRQATGGAAQAGLVAGAAPLATTHQGHIPVSTLATAGLTSTLRYASPSQTNLDRNTVDMDRERANFADNAVKYEASLRFVNGSVGTMLNAIKGQ
jgi:flagellar basal-body rod protein FlgB